MAIKVVGKPSNMQRLMCAENEKADANVGLAVKGSESISDQL
jgi:hypothetical protein